MLNQIILVGRLVKTPEVIETESSKKMSSITLAIPRTFKNADGEYDTDFVDVLLKGIVAKTTTEYCRKGDVIGVKGKVENEIINDVRKMIIVAEKIAFLSSKKEDLFKEEEVK